MIIKTLTLLLFFIPSLSFAQIAHWDKGLLYSIPSTSPPDSSMSIHVMPLSLFNYSSRIRFGGQYKKNRFGYLLDLEYGSDKLRLKFGGESDSDYRFFGFRPELRYNLNRELGRAYAAIELPFTLKYESHNGNLVDRNQNFFYVEDALERRVRVSAILKYGREVVVFRHLLIDAYVGIGVAYRYLRYTELENIGPPVEQTMEWGCCELAMHGGGYKGEFALGLRLGWVFPHRSLWRYSLKALKASEQ